ncbi:Phage major capsid protein, HK97 [uncultured Caudovirales phage]|uniref:Phage major capsid protein, HK97 n=1 Tax=uncultured Caudovirales phage TaxID=2100421 RepID=A0A6J7WZC9_9CAUD|nr:Phage major capsid protein, HK97 [uncultured Caudovirales phage]
MTNILTFSAEITANVEERTISGKIAPAGTGEVGNTSAGKVLFERGAIQLPEDPKTVKLLNQHDMKQPLGKATSFTTDETGVYASFKISRSNRGTEALILAEEGLQSGLSVGVEVIKSKMKAGVMHVSAARLFEVSLVTEPAFKSAQVIDVAAESDIEAATSTSTKTTTINTTIVETETETESETAVENTPETVAAPVEAAAVEAARPVVTATTHVRERIAPITSAQYLEASMKAALGDDESRRIVRSADDSTSTNTGLTLPSHLNTFITDTFTGRPAFEAATRGSLAGIDGMSFTVPRLYTNASTPDVAPTVADTNEGAAPSETGMTSAYDTISIEKFSGLQRVSFELVDRSSPAFMELMMAELRKAYEKATDAALLAAFVANGTTAATTAATAAGLQSFVSVEGAAAYKGTGGDFANKLVASTDQWAAIAGYADSTGRALYSAQGATQNASGNAVATSVVGGVLGTDLIVDHNISTSGIVDNSAFLVAPASVYTWESPTTQLRVNVLTSGEIEINLYGYLAIYLAKSGKGVRKFNLT